MADVFDKEPISFIDQNEQFPVLNEKVGLTYQQFKTLVENTNYLYNNLGLSSLEVGSVTTQFPSPGSFSDVIVEHNISYINGKPIDTMDFLFKLPTPRISASLYTKIVDESIPTGMTLLTSPIKEIINGAEVTTGYEFEFHANIPQSPMYYLQYVEQNLSASEKAQARANIGAGTSNFSGNYEDLVNIPSFADVSYSGLYEDLLNKPSSVLYTTQTLTDEEKQVARENIGAGTSNFNGDYNSLSNRPTRVSQFLNDANYISSDELFFVSYAEVQDLTATEKLQARNNIGAGTSNFDGNYSSLVGSPTNLSDFNNDTGFITLAEVPSTDLSNYYTKAETDNLIYSITVDLSDYYTKEQIDTLIANIEIDLTDYYTKTETDTAINTKFNSLSTVAKTGSYTDLIDTPYIPTKTSDINNDSGFITNAVDNLVNYYTKTEISNMFADNVTFKFVTELPLTGVSNVVYFVSNADGTSGNLFNEYVWTNTNTWELIGNASIDLSNYYTKTEVDSLLPDMTNYYTKSETDDLLPDITLYYTKEETNTAINNKFNTLSSVATSGSYTDLINTPNIPTKVSDLTNDSGFITASVSTLTNYYNKTTIDTMLNDIPTFDSSLYYTKTETDTIITRLPYISYEEQTLSANQKLQARTNIGAGTSNFNGSYNSLTDKPTFSTVATSGSYTDLINQPVIDTSIAQTTNAVQNQAIYNRFVSVDNDISSATTTANNAYSTAQSASSTANSINTKLNSLTLVDNGDNSYTLKFTQDNVVVGTITIPTDQYVKSITQSTINNTVKFIWNKTSTEYPDGTYTLDLKPYVYTAGNGISTSQISDTDNRNKISVYLDTADENNKLFFNSTTGGLNVDLSGYYTSVEVNKLLPNMELYYTKTEVNGLLPDLSNYYTKTETDNLLPDLSNYYTKTETYSKDELVGKILPSSSHNPSFTTLGFLNYKLTSISDGIEKSWETSYRSAGIKLSYSSGGSIIRSEIGYGRQGGLVYNYNGMYPFAFKDVPIKLKGSMIGQSSYSGDDTEIYKGQVIICTESYGNYIAGHLYRVDGTITSSSSYTDITPTSSITIDSALSTTSENAVQNKVIAEALNNKVDKETGKGLSTNDLTDTLKSNYDTAYTNNHTHSNKTILDNTTASYTVEEQTKLASFELPTFVSTSGYSISTSLGSVSMSNVRLLREKMQDGYIYTFTGTISSTTSSYTDITIKLPTLINTVTNANMLDFSIVSSGTWRNWERVNAVGGYISTGQVNIYISDDASSANRIFYLTLKVWKSS